MCGGTVNGFFISFLKGVLTMKVVYQTCCGVDVHKSFLVATIIKATSGIEPSYQKNPQNTVCALSAHIWITSTINDIETLCLSL